MINKWIRNSILGWKLQHNSDCSPLRRNIFRVLAILVAFVLAGLALRATGRSPLVLGVKVVQSTLGTGFGRQQLLILATPIILTALGFALSSKVGLFNVGGEGQLFIGAWAATGIGMIWSGSRSLGLVVILLGSMVAAGLFSLLPGWIRVKLGVSEILTTIMLNYIAFNIVSHFIRGPWKDPAYPGMFTSYRIPVELYSLSGKLHIGILIALALVILLYILFNNTVWGYELLSIGANREVARFAGISVKKYQLIIMFLSGVLAGLAGGIEITGVAHHLSSTISVFYGYHGLMVSILAGGSLLAIVFYSLFIALLLNGGLILQTQGLSNFTVLALVGLILILSVCGEVLAGYRIVRTCSDEKDGALSVLPDLS